MTALLGGTFDPPHNGHVELVRATRERLGELVVLVVARPGHKEVSTDPHARLALAQAAFPGERVELDDHARTVDLLRERSFPDPVVVIGADEFASFPTWKEPEAVLELARLAVATRPGYPSERLEAVVSVLDHSDRVSFFEIEPLPISSRTIRERVRRGEPIDGLVPPGVARLIAELWLYRSDGLH